MNISQSRNILLPQLSLLVCLLSFCIQANSITSAGNWTSRGVASGDGTCGEYINETFESRRWFEHWMLGYVSGVNASRKGKADYSNGISVKAMIQHVENYCKAKPLDTFSAALEDLIRELNGR